MYEPPFDQLPGNEYKVKIILEQAFPLLRNFPGNALRKYTPTVLSRQKGKNSILL